MHTADGSREIRALTCRQNGFSMRPLRTSTPHRVESRVVEATAALSETLLVFLHPARSTRDLFLAQRFARHVSPLTTTVYTHPSDQEMRDRLRGLTC